MADQEKSRKINNLEKRDSLKELQALDSEADVFRVTNAETGDQMLSAQQWVAIAMLVAGRRQSDIATEIGVTQETLSRWRGNPIYIAALNIATRDAYLCTIGMIRDSASAAIEALRSCLQSKDEKVRLAAALSLIKLHLQLDANAMQLKTTPGRIANDRLRRMQMAELNDLLI